MAKGSYYLSVPTGDTSFDHQDKAVFVFSTVLSNLPTIANKQFVRRLWDYANALLIKLSS